MIQMILALRLMWLYAEKKKKKSEEEKPRCVYICVYM